MIRSEKGIAIALIIPVFALAFLVGYKNFILSKGREVTLPITGYDPKSLLSGHYLSYQIDYGVKDLCHNNAKVGYICLDTKMFSHHWPENCPLIIKGTCKGSRFHAGVERYYVPETKVKRLENLIRSRQAHIVLSVLRNGKAQVKDLLIDGRSWKNHN